VVGAAFVSATAGQTPINCVATRIQQSLFFIVMRLWSSDVLAKTCLHPSFKAKNDNSADYGCESVEFQPWPAPSRCGTGTGSSLSISSASPGTRLWHCPKDQSRAATHSAKRVLMLLPPAGRLQRQFNTLAASRRFPGCLQDFRHRQVHLQG
jgi:hypothetical protein